MRARTRFGKLVTTRYVRPGYWECSCDCGNKKVVGTKNLVSGRSRSCRACRLQTNYTGKKFGRLTATGKLGRLQDGTRALLCVCTCGKKKLLALYRVLNGETKSCGCLKRELETKKDTTGLNNRIARYRVSARYRKVCWELSAEQAGKILLSECKYCGTLPAHGIDRVDNSAGYTPANAVPCCKICNRAKLNLSLDEFNLWLSRVRTFQTKLTEEIQ